MLLLTLSLLATTYAQGVEQYEQLPARVDPGYVPSKPPVVAPIDLRDDIYSSDFWSNPKAQNIIYNFEHVKRDQPPHVEAREESLGRYLYRPKPSTDTPPAAYHSEPADIHAQITDVHWYQNQQTDRTRIPTTSAAPLPDWQDTYEQDQQLYSRHRDWNPAQEAQYHMQPAYIPTQPPYIPTQSPRSSQWADYSTTTAKPQTWSDPILGNRYKPDHPNPKPTIAPLIPSYHQASEPRVRPRYFDQAQMEWTTKSPIIVPDTVPVAPMWEAPRAAPTHRMQMPRNAGRGNQRHNWSEVSTEATLAPSMVMEPTAAQGRGPPPPVPTLTPWHGDRF